MLLDCVFICERIQLVARRMTSVRHLSSARHAIQFRQDFRASSLVLIHRTIHVERSWRAMLSAVSLDERCPGYQLSASLVQYSIWANSNSPNISQLSYRSYYLRADSKPKIFCQEISFNMEVETSPSCSHRELFVVQRCWHSGPIQYQPMDLLRLFVTQRDAEEAAYHSAHAWCRHHKPHEEPQVRTLLLPSYPAHNQSGSSYGFVAYGSLFWVRSLIATSSSPVDPALIDPRVLIAAEAYGVVTEGVIGGTGNRMSRRGTEIPHGRVFLAEPGTKTMQGFPVNNYAAQEVMRRKTLEVCHQVMAQLGPKVSNSVATIPIGRPDEYTSGNFLKDWPPQVLQPNLQDNLDIDNMMKRPPQSLGRTVSQDFEEGVVVECPFEMPAAKRRRFCDNSVPFNFHLANVVQDDDTMMMSYGVVGEEA